MMVCCVNPRSKTHIQQPYPPVKLWSQQPHLIFRGMLHSSKEAHSYLLLSWKNLWCRSLQHYSWPWILHIFFQQPLLSWRSNGSLGKKMVTMMDICEHVSWVWGFFSLTGCNRTEETQFYLNQWDDWFCLTGVMAAWCMITPPWSGLQTRYQSSSAIFHLATKGLHSCKMDAISLPFQGTAK